MRYRQGARHAALLHENAERRSGCQERGKRDRDDEVEGAKGRSNPRMFRERFGALRTDLSEPFELQAAGYW
jgi:hypothetical protein